MWIVPTYGRPQRCQQLLDSIAAARPCGRGIVIIDGSPETEYGSLRLPPGWHRVERPTNHGVCAALNLALELYPDEPFYGFVSDDSFVGTADWSAPLVEAAGTAGFATSADGWQAGKRMHGAVAIGGDLVRALGWIAPPGLVHSFVDDAWEWLADKLFNWTHVPRVMVEHRHRANGLAENEPTYDHAYATMDRDRDIYADLIKTELPAAFDRAAPVVERLHPLQQRRMSRVKSRSLLICTPVGRDPVWRYTKSLVDTTLLLERHGVRHRVQFIVGNSNLPRARNELVAEFLATDFTDMLMVDDDMEWRPEDVLRLLASDKPLIGGAGRKRIDKSNTDPAVWCWRLFKDGDRMLRLDDFGAIEVRGVGTGFLLANRSVFLRMIEAHPDWKRNGHGVMTPAVRDAYYRFFRFGDDADETGEDYLFCQAWRELGGSIWVLPDIVLGHVGSHNFKGSVSEVLVAEDDDPVLAEAAE